MLSKQQLNSFKQNASQRLTGKIAIITGASRGIGAAAAHLFAQDCPTVSIGF